MIETRSAEPHDIADLVELRLEMFRASGVEETDPGFREACRGWFEALMSRPDRHHIAVVEADGRVVAAAMGILSEANPSPMLARAQELYVLNVCTLPAYRGRGYGTATLRAVLDWGRAQPGPVRAKLSATSFGRKLYEREGFTQAVWPAMRLEL